MNRWRYGRLTRDGRKGWDQRPTEIIGLCTKVSGPGLSLELFLPQLVQSGQGWGGMLE